jgi:S-adenosylmethionine decarboxylase
MHSSERPAVNGIEWIIDARGCSAVSLRNLDRLRALFEQIISDLDLRTIGETRWHEFPGCGGITGLCLLSESHLACHTFPEHHSLCLNLFCCRPHPRCDFERVLAKLFSASAVDVQAVPRDYVSKSEQEPALHLRESQ